MLTSNRISDEKQGSGIASDNVYMRYLFVALFGFILLALGALMVTGIYTWEIFSIWLPMSLFIVGFILLSSKTYSTWLGFLLLILGGLFWLHDVSMSSLPNLTRIIDWSFVIIGTTIIYLSLVGLQRKKHHIR
jgi:hypothetical protein